jgi:Xaa-Pro aminopeptidase
MAGENVEAGTRIGFDALLMTNAEFEQLSATPCELVPLKASPFDTLWTDRPAAPAGLIREMPVEHSGESSADKRQRVAAVLAETMLIIWPLRCRITSPGC